jgi:hypothetical protein
LSLEYLRDWGPFICTVLGNAALAWLGTRFAGKREVAEARQHALDAHHRIDLLEKDVKGLPSYDVTNKLRETIVNLDRHLAERDGDRRALEAKVQGVDEKLERVQSTVDRFEQHLLNTSRS